MKHLQTYEGFNEKKPGPHPYHRDLSDDEVEDKEAQMKKQAEMDDDNPEAYKEMPGDKEAREKGQVKTSKHVKNYHELYGDEDETDEALSDYEIKKRGYKKLYKDYPYKKKAKKKELVKESRMDSDYLQRMLRTLAQDYKKQGEKDLYKFYDYLETRLNQSYPSGDVDRDDIEDIMNDSRFRKMRLDIPDWAIDDLFESTVNEESQDAYTIRRLTSNTVGGDEVDNFLKKHPNVSLDKIKFALRNDDLNKHGLRNLIQGKLNAKMEKQALAHITESINEANKIACLECDEVNSVKAWKKNNDVCPSCNDSTNGVSESVINEEKAKGDRSALSSDVETALKKKADETGVPISLLRIVYRRGAAAWKTGHRPGAGQEQWAYARVNSFLTKQPGTWGGADKDVAKEVRDGGHDTKLKKG